MKQQLQAYPPLFTSTDFANQINQRARLDLPPDVILGKFHVQAQPDILILVIKVDDASPQQAQKIADASADIIIEKNLSDIEGLNPDQQVYINKLAPANLPDKPSSPRTNLLTGAGAGVGLVLGAILMFVIEFLDNTLKDPRDIERYTGLNTLGQIPRWKVGGPRSQPLSSQPNVSNNGLNKATSEQSGIKSKP